jgi:shikimate dehydrogenase
MSEWISKDTVLCMSLSGRPSNFGTRFHNFLYRELGLNYLYKAFTTRDLSAAIGGVRALGIRGCSVSMPFKEACMAFLDDVDPTAATVGSVNTIVNGEGCLRGHNTDYVSVLRLLQDHVTGPHPDCVLRGSGGMAKAMACALRDAGFAAGLIVARNETAGRCLGQKLGYDWRPTLGPLRPAVLVNATPIGMAGGAEATDLAFEPDVVDAADLVVDAVAVPSETPLIRYARRQKKRVITGADIIALQALEQFELYTGVRPTDDQVRRAAVHASKPAS